MSREFNATLEWTLNSSFFDKVVQGFSRPTVDLFASRVNYRLPAYVSWKPDPNAFFVDAFSISWAQFTHGYVFPPFCLLSRCIQKIAQEKATVTMENANMVYRSTEPVDRTTACFPRDQRCSIQSSSTGSTSFSPQALPYGMQMVRKHFLNSSVPPQITDVIMSSCRQGTQK